jgi:fermentation-respiration switch protein FrsA (DUF1100 family)
MKSVQFRNKDMYWDIAADIHFPPAFDEKKKYPAIISAHPIGSCKEQTSGNVYGTALAKEGFVVVAFDASFQGASGGEPRSIEDPTLRVEDFRHVADYLVTLPYVDEDRIGVLGICGGGGYSINAAMTERRIKAVGTVTGANYGRLMRRVQRLQSDRRARSDGPAEHGGGAWRGAACGRSPSSIPRRSKASRDD